MSIPARDIHQPRPAAGRPQSPWVIYPSQVFSGATVITLGPLLDPILRDLHIPLAKGGMLSFGFFLGRVAGVLLLNFGLARVPIKTIMVSCVTLLMLGSVAAALLGVGLWPLIGALFVTGMAGVIPNAISGVWVAGNIKVGLEKAMISIGAYFALGVLAAPLVIGAALGAGANWKEVFLGQAGFAAIMLVVMALLPLPDVHERENLRGPQLKAVVSTHPSLFVVILAATFLYVCVEGTLYVWLAKLQVEAFAAGPGVAALSVTILWGGIAVGRYVAAPLTRVMAPGRLLLIFATVLAVFVGGLALAPNLAASEVFAFFAGIGASACWPLISCYAPRFPGWQAGVVFSGMMLVGTIANTVSPYLFGPAVAALGVKAALGLWLIPIAGVLALGVALDRIARRIDRQRAAGAVESPALSSGEF